MPSYGLEPQVVMTTPLLEGTDGVEKMSKSLGNYIGVTESPDAMYAKVMSISDELMWRYYLLLSSRGAAEVEALKAGHPMDAKHALAQEVVARYHGPEEATQAADGFRKQFSRRELPDEIPELTVTLDRPALYRVLAEAGLCKSGSDATRLITGGGVDIDGAPARDPKAELEKGKTVLLRVGKRRYARVTVS
jgi:tyrosyl-tRNA synthetase